MDGIDSRTRDEGREVKPSGFEISWVVEVPFETICVVLKEMWARGQ
jgi:hypothetical protein